MIINIVILLPHIKIEQWELADNLLIAQQNDMKSSPAFPGSWSVEKFVEKYLFVQNSEKMSWKFYYF